MTEVTEVYRVTRSRAPRRKGYDKHGQVLAGKFRVKTIVAAIKAENTSARRIWEIRDRNRKRQMFPDMDPFVPETFTVERAYVGEFTDVTGEFV